MVPLNNLQPLLLKEMKQMESVVVVRTKQEIRLSLHNYFRVNQFKLLLKVYDHIEAHSPNGYKPHMSTTNRRDQPSVALSSDARDLLTLEVLSIVMRHAKRLHPSDYHY